MVLDFAISSSAPGLVNATLSVLSATLDFTANQTGLATIAVTATDSGGKSISDSFAVTVGQPVPPTDFGLLGTYFDSINLTNPASQRLDATVNFGNDSLGDDAGGQVTADDNYSIRWQGFVLIERSGNWQFSTYSNDGVACGARDCSVGCRCLDVRN